MMLHSKFAADQILHLTFTRFGCRYARLDFSWDLAGQIDAVCHFVAIPNVQLSLSSSRVDQTVLAAFVLLVLLAAAQTGWLVYSCLHEMHPEDTLWKALQVCSLAKCDGGLCAAGLAGCWTARLACVILPA